MLRANFFYKFFKHNPISHSEIVKYNLNKKFNLEDEMHLQIVEIDKQISENSKAIIEAQIVKFRSTISKSNNFIEIMSQNVYKVKLEDSINWHQKQLKELIIRRKKLQINLEKHKGIYWLNRIKRFLMLVILGFALALSLFIFFSGFMIFIYLLPIILLIFLGYLTANRK